MSTYFKLEEFLRSDTAKANKIANNPSWEVVEHLKTLALFLDGLREKWGPINVTSGFRCEELNVKVGGKNRSAHKMGYAADIQPNATRDFEKFKQTVLNWIQDKDFDQCIIESSGGTTWIHIGLYNQDMEQRHETFSLRV